LCAKNCRKKDESGYDLRLRRSLSCSGPLLIVLVACLLAPSAGRSAADATFPGTNGPIVFDGVDSPSQSLQVYRMAADGSGLVELTDAGTAGLWNECPAWSADAATIFFDSKEGAAAPSLIYKMNADGTGRSLADKATKSSQRACPSAGPGGAMVYAIQEGRQSNAVIRQRADGSGRRMVARAKRLQMFFQPLYAPDGRHAVFNRLTFGKSGRGIARADILVTNGLRTRSITGRGTTKFFSPSWSPDGTTLLAVRGNAGIVRMDANGSAVQALITVPGVVLFSPVYSPDASKIAYIQCEGDCGDPMNPQGRGSIWVMNADGTGNHAVLTQAATGVQPATRLAWGVSG
jgi:Tol biopolymer transport system component